MIFANVLKERRDNLELFGLKLHGVPMRPEFPVRFDTTDLKDAKALLEEL